MRSPTRIGLDVPGPGSLIFQARFCFGPQTVGTFLAELSPMRVGPRNCGQMSLGSPAGSGPAAAAMTVPAMTVEAMTVQAMNERTMRNLPELSDPVKRF